MASENTSAPECSAPLEEKIADLHLEEKIADLHLEEKAEACADEATKINAGEPEDKLGECKETVVTALEEAGKEEEKPSDQSVPEEVDVAMEEVAKGADEGAYAVPTVDHRSIPEPEGEEKKVDVPTAVVHENADAVGKQQQGKSIIQSVTGRVKNVFSGLIGSKKATDAQTESTQK